MAKLLMILLVALVLESIGVVYLSKGIKQVGEIQRITVPAVIEVLKRGIRNPNVLLGVLFEALFFAGLLILLSKGDVSFIWPLTSVSLIMTAFAAKIFLGEEISGARWIGIILIMCGAMLVTWSEKVKEARAREAALQAKPL